MSANLFLHNFLESGFLSYKHICLLQDSDIAQENEIFSDIVQKCETNPNKDNINNHKLQEIKWRNTRRHFENCLKNNAYCRASSHFFFQVY